MRYFRSMRYFPEPLMRLAHLSSLGILCLLLQACTLPGPQPGSVQRMSPQDLANFKVKPNPGVPLDEIVALSQAGTTPEVIIARLTATATVHALTPAQIVVLARNGVDQKVIDHLALVQEKARQATLITQLADRDAQAAAELEQERAYRRALQQRQDQFYWGFNYGPWGPGFGPGWGRGYYYDPFYRRFGPRW